jgi:hypothetical protein
MTDEIGFRDMGMNDIRLKVSDTLPEQPFQFAPIFSFAQSVRSFSQDDGNLI